MGIYTTNVILTLLGSAVVSGVFVDRENGYRLTRQAPPDDECRPPRPGHNDDGVCCDMPPVFRTAHDKFESCLEELSSIFPPPPPPNGHHGPPPPGGPGGHGPPPPPPPGGRRGPPPGFGGPPGHEPPIFACAHECLFNKTGLLENGKLNVEALKKKLEGELGDDEVWKNLLQSIVDKCMESKDPPSNDMCTSGSHELARCVLRDMFMNCPQEKWKESDDCSNMKMKLEKCPELVPPMAMRLSQPPMP
uniref:Odorant-binding protein 6 n=2 Tax=Sogatella furcifera TaxID=113103 RepID=V5T768_SOGFU|nr:odorant-binding protein 6 [Sogatella furcifera]